MGIIEEGKGKVKEAAGDLSDNPRLEQEGRGPEGEGARPTGRPAPAKAKAHEAEAKEKELEQEGRGKRPSRPAPPNCVRGPGRVIGPLTAFARPR